MKILNQFGHQGDTQWYSIDQIPKGAKKVSKQFIAASERSGSFHALFGNYDIYEVENGFIIDAKEDCILNHSLESELKKINDNMDDVKILPKKDHRFSTIPKGLYIAGIQRRFDPMKAIMDKMKD